ncbi:ferredoxin [Nocardia panacis]|uniref:Ferredoxin n=1 Tax=Nocardia panacis TaxID=2340916 RepID=A0A3A4KBZ0_9NOCA|nr:ferredoxin [Nocardia panacis]RJO77618.1 ferredoxin [Nocardia panacis]
MDAKLIIDTTRCGGTGVCLPIAAPHLRLIDGHATAIDATTLAIAQARAAAACCPNEALTVCEVAPGAFRVAAPIVTLGPDGTDAQAEAEKHSEAVVLVQSFAVAMRTAADDAGVRALVAAGYLALDEQSRATDSWVDQHFAHTGVLRLERCWESPTKPMCFATRHNLAGRGTVATVATHPATRVFAAHHAQGAHLITVNAKPLAAAAAARGDADACITSVDVAQRYPELAIRAEFAPTMVWLLYGKAGCDD